MARVRERLSKAPVREAVLDFRTRVPPDTPLEALKTALAGLAASYPQVEDYWLVEGSLEFSPQHEKGGAVSSKKTAIGFLARTQDGRHVAQFRLDGFTFSRLAPYTSFEAIESEAFRLWDVYREAAKPSALYRIAVRYINHIPLPATLVEMNEILFSAPQVPSDLPQFLHSFFTRVMVPVDLPNAYASIVQAYNMPPAATENKLLLDVDVFLAEELDLAPQALRPLFQQLRAYKNQAFFGSLTEEMLGRLE